MKQSRCLAAAALACMCNATAAPVINEINFHPPHPDGGENVLQEWIELHNPDAAAVDLSNWALTSGVSFIFPPGTSIPAGGYLVVAADLPTFQAGHPDVTNAVGGWSGRLSNSGEQIELSDAIGERVDRVRYFDDGDWADRRPGPDDNGYTGWTWFSGADGGGSTLQLINHRLSNNNGQNWQHDGAAGGTPGAANEPATDNIAPLIDNVRHHPAVPTPDDLVTITAELSDESAGATTASVYYRVSENDPGDFIPLPMRDDGLGGDGSPLDGTFTANLPSHPERTVVEFYIQASDTTNTRTFPAPTSEEGDRGADLLYQVDSETPSPDHPLYRVIMTEDDDDEFDDLPLSSGNRSNAQFNATFISTTNGETTVRYQTGVRLRGAGSRRDYPRSIRVNFPTAAPWETRTAINLNTQYSYLQVLGSQLFHAAGLPCFQSKPVAVRMNGTDHASQANASGDDPFENHYGLYVHNEPLDDAYLANHYPDDDNGNLYKKRGAGATDWELPDTDEDAGEFFLDEGWSKLTNASAADWSDLVQFLTVMRTPVGPDYLEQINTVMDVDQWLRNLAVHAVLTNGENSLPTGVDDDYSIYRTAGGSFHLLPHDLDTILGLGDGSAIEEDDLPYTVFDFASGGSNGDSIGELRPLFRQPEVVQAYYAYLYTLLDGPFSAAQFDRLVDRTLGGWTPSSVRSDIKSFMAARRADIRSQLSTPLTGTSDFQNRGGFPTTTQPYTVANGTFDASRARSVTVAGKTATLNFRDATWTYAPPTDTLVAENATWRYLDDGSDQGTAWRAPAFDDSLWQSGPAPLGYGDDGEDTVIAGGENNHFTNYFRHSFEVGDPAAYDTVTVRLRRDDGAVIYLNGSEVVRDNLSTFPTLFDTPADENQVGDPESDWYTFQIAPGDLLPGTNIIAAEVHQINDTSPDFRFELELTATTFDSEFLPGVNRLTVVEYDAGGVPLSTSHVDIFFDDGDTSTISGTLTEDTTLDAASGPWEIPSNLTVPDGITLTIEPGTTLLFGDSDRLIIQPGGRLVCDGTPERRIRLTRALGASFTWDGIEFTGTDTENSISYTDMEWGDDQGDSIVVDNSRLVLDHVTWDHCDETVIEADSPQLIITDCSFPQISSAEVIHGSELEGDDFFIIQRCTFVASSGYNDTIDFAGGARPGPIFTAYDNVFFGATDDCFDLDGTDAHIEGNVFINVHLDTDRDSTSNAIATDDGSKVTVVRNIFYDVDHALLLKNEAEAIFENNTVIGATIAAINLDEPQRSGFLPGRSIAMDSNLFFDVEELFAEEFSSNGEPDPVITGHRNIISAEKFYIGDDNIDTRPYFQNPGALPLPKINVALLPGTPGTGAGRNGRDIGAGVQRGVTPSGEPVGLTRLDSATLQTDGPGITDFRWRLVTDGAPAPWSAELPLGTPVVLSELAPATYRVEFVAKDSAGYWQPDDAPSVSKTWTVDPAAQGGVLLSEIQAAHPTAPDAIELHNSGTTAVNLTGWSLTDSPANVTRYTFPPGTAIPAGGYLVFDATTSGIGLDRDGDSTHLYNNGALVDEVTFGLQVSGYTIARTGADHSWNLATPTLASPNTPVITAPPHGVRINEWLASSEVTFDDDFVELYNPSTFPADISRCLLSDDPSTGRRHPLPPLSFLAPGGFNAFRSGSTHFPYRLDAFYDWVAFMAPDGSPIDLVHVLCSTPDTSEGREPDGSESFATFSFPTFGQSNHNSPGGETVITDTPLVPLGQVWTFADALSGTPDDWTTPAFDDFTWRRGPSPIGSDDDQDPDFFGTDLTDTYRESQITYYFRTTFEFDGDPGETHLVVSRYIDDGYVLYLNGVPVDDKNIDNIPPSNGDEANTTVGDADEETDITVSTAALVNGTNLLTAEVHQGSDSSSDIVFGVALSTRVTTFIPDELEPELKRVIDLADHLRVTELHYDPANGSDYEFVELQNTSDTLTLQLGGVAFTGGISFTFPEMDLAPGAYVIVARDAAAFESVYGSGLNLAGTYSGKLGNAGEEIALRLPPPYPNLVQRFTYDDAWFPSTDGLGKSLEIIDPGLALSTWNLKSSWRPSTADGGTPAGTNAVTSFATWAAAYGADAQPATADIDADGLSLLYEYGLGLLPHIADTPAGQLAAAVDQSNHFTASFSLPAQAPPDITYTVEISGALDSPSWNTVATKVGTGLWSGSATVATAPPSGGRTTVLVTAPDPVDTNARYFTRLRIASNSP